MHSAVNTAECLLSWVISNWRFCFETTQDYIQLNTSKNLSLLARALSETPLVHGQHSQIFGDMEARHINKLRLLQQPPLPSRPSFLPNSKNYRSSVIFRMDILILHSNNPILLQSDIPRETGPSQGWHDPWPRSPGVQIMWSNSRCCLHTSATLQMQLFVSDLPLNQSEYTADTLSSNQNRVEFYLSSSHWPIYNKLYPEIDISNLLYIW